MRMPPLDDSSSLLRPKALSGVKMEYVIGNECLIITDISQTDASKRRIEVSWGTLSRFVSELQEIEALIREEAGMHRN